jgi:hypothetical protein
VIFELGTKEFEGIKDSSLIFASLIPSNSFVPNSNGVVLKTPKSGSH